MSFMNVNYLPSSQLSAEGKGHVFEKEININYLKSKYE